MKPGNKIFTYNMDFIHYVSQLGWRNSVLCYYYYQGLPNQIQDPIFIQEQGKAFTAGNAMVSQNKTNISLMALSAKLSSSKPLFSTSKKQSNSLQIDISFKLASNGKLTSNEYKKHLENNLCLYCHARDHKLDSCSKKQTTVTFKGYSTIATASEKPLEKQRATSRTPHKLRAPLNFPMQQQVLSNSMYLLFLICIHSFSSLLLL